MKHLHPKLADLHLIPEATWELMDAAREAGRQEERGKIVKHLNEQFPKDVFIPPSKEQYMKLHSCLVKCNLTLDKFSGDMIRRVNKNLSEELKEQDIEVK